MAYSLDLITGGTPSADTENSAGYEADKACDDNTGTSWASSVTAFPHWWKYDFGVGITKIITRITLLSTNAASPQIKNFTLQGSNNDSSWTTVYTGLTEDNTNVQTFSFSNGSAYRYYMINATDSWFGGNTIGAITEIEMMSGGLSSGFFALL